MKKALPHEMTTQEVEEMVEKFGDAALRAKKADSTAYRFMEAMAILSVNLLLPIQIRESINMAAIW